MSTENNTPAPGSPEWLRDEANHCECRGDPQEIPNGLRAAAERIEELEESREEWHLDLDRLRTENEALRADKERLDWLLKRGAVGHFSEWRDAKGGKERTLFRLYSRAAIDAARKEGA